jgi:hypothetical protein
MKIHCLAHVPFEDAANIGRWAKETVSQFCFESLFHPGSLGFLLSGLQFLQRPHRFSLFLLIHLSFSSQLVEFSACDLISQDS